jgi:hypothetical protein
MRTSKNDRDPEKSGTVEMPYGFNAHNCRNNTFPILRRIWPKIKINSATDSNSGRSPL